MTRDLSTLMAQVVPVVALALGLEFRQLAREAVDEIDVLRVDLALRIHFLLTLGVLAMCLLGLAVLENVSLGVAAEQESRTWWMLGLYTVVIITFSAPVVDLGHRLIGALVRRPWRRDLLLTTVLLGIPLALFSATVVIVH